MHPHWISPVATLAVMTAASGALADWPIARHDPQRTGFAPGTTNIDTPGLAWSYYLGGALKG